MRHLQGKIEIIKENKDDESESPLTNFLKTIPKKEIDTFLSLSEDAPTGALDILTLTDLVQRVSEIDICDSHSTSPAPSIHFNTKSGKYGKNNLLLQNHHFSLMKREPLLFAIY